MEGGGGVVDLGKGKRDMGDQERNGDGLESAIPNDQHPKKFIRTGSFPFRTVASSAAVTATSASPAGAAATPQLPPLYPSSGANNGGNGGPALYYTSAGGVCNSAAKASQPFSSSFKSQAVGLGHAVTLRCTPFTAAQWQELNRQALIYKHFASSAPVPPALLFDARAIAIPGIPPLYPELDRGGGRCFNLPFTTNTDPEPGRCRRTDGKKWRCSRDVAPDQKYCERHMHRGRPRSRKPVELRQKTSAGSAASDIITSTTTTTASSTSPTVSLRPNPYGQSPPTAKLRLAMAPEKELRYLDLLKGGLEEIHPNDNNSIGLRPSSPLASYQLKFNSLNDPSNSFLNQYLSSLDTALDLDHRCPSRSFIEAWSNDKSPLSSASKLSPSTLTLSMSGGGAEDADQIHMGLGINDSLGRSQPLSWMNPVTPLGGPLAEVLRSGAASTSSPYNSRGEREGPISTAYAGFGSCCGNDGVMSPRNSPTRVVSSPTGVLQKTFVSLSDSSDNSSPTFVSCGGRSETGRLHWPGQPQ